MDPTAVNREEEKKEKTVSEIIECSHELARELLASCGGDVNKVIDTFLGSKVFEGADVDQDTGITPESTGTAGGISSVLKRKRPIGSVDKNASDIDEENIDKDHPDKIKFMKLREDMSNYLVEVRKSVSKGKEEAMMKLEDCPVCSAPQILQDKTVLQFKCAECGAVTFRKFKQQAHGDRECEEKDKVKLECGEKDEEYKKVNVLPSRSFDVDSELEREFRIAEGHFLRMVRRRKNYEIKSIDIVHNEKLKKKFDQKKQEFKMNGLDDKPLLIFHGTPQENIDHILRENFDLSKVANGRKYGNGVYFSEVPDVSMKYTKDQSSLILCLVLQGDNSNEVKIPQTGVQAIDTQTSMIGALAIVVPDIDQILPKYVINFTDKPKDTEKQQQVVISPGSLSSPTGSSGSANISNLASNLAAGFLARPFPASGFSVPTSQAPGFLAPSATAPSFLAPTAPAHGFSAPLFLAPGFSASSVYASSPSPGQATNSQSSISALTNQPAPAAMYAGQAGNSLHTMPNYNLMPQMSQIMPQVSQFMSQQTLSCMPQAMQQTTPGVPQAMSGMPQAMQQTTPGVPQAMSGMPQAMQQTTQGMPQAMQHTIPGMQQTIPRMPQAMSRVPHAMSGITQAMQQIMPQAMSQTSPITQFHPTTSQPPTSTAVAFQQQAAARQAQWRAMVNAVAGTITAQARTQAASSAVSNTAAHALLAKSTKGKVGRPPKVTKVNEKVTDKGDVDDCGGGSGNLENIKDFHCGVCNVKLSSKELLEEHKKEREHRMKERSSK